MKLASRPLVAGTVGLSLAATLAVTATGGTPADARTAPLAEAPVPAVPDEIPTSPATVRTIPLTPTGARAAAARPSAAADAAVPAGRTAAFSLVGVTWTDPHAVLRGTAQVRTRAVGGAWSPWRTLEADGETGPDAVREAAALRGSTDPLWVGDSDGVEAPVVTPSGAPAAGLPAGLRLDLVDPGTTTPSPAQGRAATAQSAGTAGTVPTPPARPAVPIVRRSQWGANENLMPHKPKYTGPVQV